MALRPKTKPAQEETVTVEETAPAIVATTGPVAVAAQPAESQEADSDNSPRETLRWTPAMDKALVSLIAANTAIDETTNKRRCSLTREEAAIALSQHPEFAAVSSILTGNKGGFKVGLRAGQLRRPVARKGGGLAGLPKFRSIGGAGAEREFYNPSNIAAELANEFSQFATAPAVPDNQPTVAG